MHRLIPMLAIVLAAGCASATSSLPAGYETWTLDQTIASVTAGDDGTTIVIEDRGRVPMPVHLTITHANGSAETREVPVDLWLAGQTRTTVTIEGEAPVTRVEIDADRDFPDVDRGNNVWTR